MDGLPQRLLPTAHCSTRPSSTSRLDDRRSCSSSTISSSDYKLSLLQRMIASGTGAICTALFMTPLDVVKIRLQNQRHAVHTGECFIYSNGLMDHVCKACESPHKKVPCEWYERPGNFTGTLDAFMKIPRQEGLRSLWSGLLPTLVMAVPSTVFYFSAYDCLLNWVRSALVERERRMRGGGDSSLASPIRSPVIDIVPAVVAGTVARSSAVALVAPLEVVRTKMQSEHMSLSKTGDAVRSSLQTHGWRGLYLGVVPTLYRDVPFSALYWSGYEMMKTRLTAMEGRDRDDVHFLTGVTAGAISGTFASVVTNPFDVVKTKRQIELGNMMTKKEANELRRQSMVFVMKRLVSERGIGSLWAGIVPRVAKVAPACAIMIGSYEHFKRHFTSEHANS